MKKQGAEKTFLVKVIDTQNATWQGTVAWTEGGRQEHFRSALELIRLIDSAIENEGKNKEEDA